jgi:hypothetical protein
MNLLNKTSKFFTIIILMIDSYAFSESPIRIRSINIQKYQPVLGGVNHAESADFSQHVSAGVSFDYARAPLVVESTENFEPYDQIIEHMTTAHLNASWAPNKRFSLGIHLPYISHSNDIVYDYRDDFEEVTIGQVNGIGDMTFQGKVMVFGQKYFSLAIMPAFILSMSDGSQYISDAAMQWGSYVGMSGNTDVKLRWAVNIGYFLYSDYWEEIDYFADQIFENRTRFVLKTGLSYELSQAFSLSVGSHSHIGESTEYAYEMHEMTGQIEYKFLDGGRLFAGSGYGFGGAAAPDYRFLGGFSWAINDYSSRGRPKEVEDQKEMVASHQRKNLPNNGSSSLKDSKGQKSRIPLSHQQRQMPSQKPIDVPWYQARPSDNASSSTYRSINQMQDK